SIDPHSALGRGLSDADAEAIEATGALDLGSGQGEDTADHRRALFAVIEAASHGNGCLGVLSDRGSETPFPRADRGRLGSLAALLAPRLGAPAAEHGAEGGDGRSRIARDLHDLAIQELFAVGMELEGLTDALATPDEPPSNARIRAAVTSSVQGVENAVAQIRQIVQSLRRERIEATLSERLRHEVGLATSGLGFV